jgi:hypothetical protein
MPNEIELDGLIDRATTAARETAVADGPPADVVQRVRQSGAGLVLRTSATRRRRPLVAMIAVAAAVLLASGLLSLPHIGRKSGGGGGNGGGVPVAGLGENLAFADVLHELKRVKTVTYHEHVVQKGSDEYVSDTSCTVAMDGKYSRDETLDEHGKPVQVAIYNAGRMLNYNFTEKKASLYDYTTDDGAGHFLDDRHTLADLLKLDPAKAEQLGVREFAGKRLAGFRVNRNYDKRNLRSVDVWANPKTRLPERVEHTIAYRYPNDEQSAAIAARKDRGDPELTREETEKMMDSWPWVKVFSEMTQIIFDVPVDESTFSLEPPKGYELTVTKVR